MKHFREQCTDFVISTNTKKDMERHLARGCEACNQAL